MINTYINKEQRSKIINPNLYFKRLEKEQTKLKISREKEITKIREEINKTRKEKNQRGSVGFLKKIMNTSLFRLKKKK